MKNKNPMKPSGPTDDKDSLDLSDEELKPFEDLSQIPIIEEKEILKMIDDLEEEYRERMKREK